MEKTQLEVGDKITVKFYNSINEFIAVTRVTAKRAFCLSANGRYETQFEREYKGSYLKPIGGITGGKSYYLTTQSHLDEGSLKVAKTTVEARFNLVKSKLTMKDCEALMDILNAIQ